MLGCVSDKSAGVGMGQLHGPWCLPARDYLRVRCSTILLLDMCTQRARHFHACLNIKMGCQQKEKPSAPVSCDTIAVVVLSTS